MRRAITQPDGLLSGQRPVTGQQAEPEATRRAEASAQFLPVQVWTPRGGFAGPLQRHDGGQPLQLFVQVSLGLFSWSHRCKVRKTFQSTKIRQSFLLCVFVFFCFFGLSLPSLVLSRCETRQWDLGGLLFQTSTLTVINIRWIYEAHSYPVSDRKKKKACSYITAEATVIIFLCDVRPLIFQRARTASFIMPEEHLAPPILQPSRLLVRQPHPLPPSTKASDSSK